MTNAAARRHSLSLSRRTLLAGTAGLAGAAALKHGSAAAQEAGKVGTPANVITSPPRQWGGTTRRSTRTPT